MAQPSGGEFDVTKRVEEIEQLLQSNSTQQIKEIEIGISGEVIHAQPTKPN